ncbi:MAG: flagellar hook-basal body complex protein FliE [Clostridium septicum]|uniref:flagellar hook-basal body complex protein FliE n=1 Tax=Clostridium septicum TaxID=1504 RepID=UPI0025885B6E|nr:flagellar hook-basal body complex protein FliE [Clostridium septicum]MDU1313957.1 flagellar hook-basal body complex protein FliE [Clostridium septicum]
MRVNSFIPANSNLEINSAKDGEEKVNSFKSFLKEGLDKLNEKQVVSDKLTEEFESGDIDVHKMMLATEEAKMSLQLAVQVRNKFVEAIQELTRTQL